MKRRDFLKFIGVGGAGAGLGFIFGKATKPPGAKLIPYLVPPEDTVPGLATWYASLCSECGAGCGTLVKVMEGRAKKIEGNPKHPVNKGKLCARGHAALQAIYNPDRIKGPLKRTGERGAGGFVEITWEEGISLLSKKIEELGMGGNADKLYFLTEPLGGHLGTLASSFMSAYGSPNYMPYELFQRRNLAYANQLTMSLGAYPHYDIENTNYLLSFGADFSTSWLSPVGMSLGYGRMRQGRSERGRLVQVEPRMSLTGANADEWVAPRPGTEGLLALSIAYAIVEKGYSRASDASSWRSALAKYRPKDVAEAMDVDEERIYRIAREFATTRPSLAIGGDNMEAYENGLSGLVAVNILNHVAGNIGIKGGLLPNPEGAFNAEKRRAKGLSALLAAAASSKAGALIVYNANPVFTAPKAAKAEEAIKKIPFIVSLSCFMDETTALSDLILPAHHPLEDWGDDFNEPSIGYQVATVRQPAVTPYRNTKGLGDILLAAAKGSGGRLKDRFQWNSFGDYLKDSWKGLYGRNRELSAGSISFDDFWNKLLANGGWWPAKAEEKRRSAHVTLRSTEHLSPHPAKFDGEGKDYPFYLTMYPHAGYRDGRGANLPWLQEMPDPMTSVVWGTWVEMNPKSAAKLGISEGEMVSIESPYGKISAPVYLYPGIRPDTVSIPVGQGHSSYGKYAKGRGANPIEILPYKEDPKTGAIALNSVRVKIARTGEPGGLVKYEGSTKEFGRGIVQTVTPEEFKRMKG